MCATDRGRRNRAASDPGPVERKCHALASVFVPARSKSGKRALHYCRCLTCLPCTVCLCVSLRLCLSFHLFLSMCVSMSVFICLCVRLCMSLYLCVSVPVRMRAHAHVGTHWLQEVSIIITSMARPHDWVRANARAPIDAHTQSLTHTRTHLRTRAPACTR